MRATFFAASALCGLVAAFPQKIDVDAAEAVPTPAAPLGPNISNPVPVPITYNQAAATKSAAKAVATGGVDKDNTVIVKRGVNDPCAQQPGG